MDDLTRALMAHASRQAQGGDGETQQRGDKRRAYYQRLLDESEGRAIPPQPGSTDPDYVASIPDADKYTTSLAASAVDPFNIPSSLLGLVAPQTRDAWRSAQKESPSGGFVGSMLSGGGAYNAASKALTAAKAGLTSQVALGAGSGAGSDAIDAAAGEKVDPRHALAKALIGGGLAAPMRYAVPTVAGGAAVDLGLDPVSQMMGAGAQAALPPEKQRRLDEINATISGPQFKTMGPQARGALQREKEALEAQSAADDAATARSKRQLDEEAARAEQIRRNTAADATLKDQIERERKIKDQNTPISQLYPTETMLAQGGTLGAGLLLSALMKYAGARRYNATMTAAEKRASDAVGNAEKAYAANDFAGAAYHREVARAAQQQIDDLAKTGIGKDGSIWPAIGGAEIAAVGPSWIDHYTRSTSGSELHKNSNPTSDWQDMASRFAGSAALGLGLGKMAQVPGYMAKRAVPATQSGAIAALDRAANGAAVRDVDMMGSTAAEGAKAAERAFTSQQAAQGARGLFEHTAQAADEAALARASVGRPSVTRPANTGSAAGTPGQPGTQPAPGQPPQTVPAQNPSTSPVTGANNASATGESQANTVTHQFDPDQLRQITAALMGGSRAQTLPRQIAGPSAASTLYDQMFSGPAGQTTPRDASRAVYDRFALNRPAPRGRGGLTQEGFADKVNTELRNVTGNPKAEGLNRTQLDTRRKAFEAEVADMMKRNAGMSYPEARDAVRNDPALANRILGMSGVGATGAAIGAGALSDAEEPDDESRRRLARALMHGASTAY